MTYSIVACDLSAGEMGVAVQSHFFGVGSLVPWARAGVGVIATQSVVNPDYGQRGLALLSQGGRPSEVLDQLLASDVGAGVRQVAIMAPDGESAGHTGGSCIGHAGSAATRSARAQANLVAAPVVWLSMIESFESSSGPLASRLIAALRAGEAAGGDLRGRQAAAILVVRTHPVGRLTDDLLLDLRVDDHSQPLDELDRLYRTSQALSCLLRLLETDGLLAGELTADEPTVAAALEQLEAAQGTLGAANHEPTVWRGLLLARAGQLDAAREHFARARVTIPRVRELVRQLGLAGMWALPIDQLEALLPASGEPGTR